MEQQSSRVAETVFERLILECGGSDLGRQNSSPAGFFSDYSDDINGFSNMRGDRHNLYTPQIATTHFEASQNCLKTELKTQNIQFGSYGATLTHHSSLPSDFSIDRVLNFQSSVPSTNMRAKRGFATHPRSIAERNRRTRINDRIRKLEDLFPNLDKQANTSLKLESVLEYIKDLQKQIKILSETKAKCLCSSKRLYATNPSA